MSCRSSSESGSSNGRCVLFREPRAWRRTSCPRFGVDGHRAGGGPVASNLQWQDCAAEAFAKAVHDGPFALQSGTRL
jgi:hypothetical protein